VDKPADTGPALLTHGFRPFFLAAGLWAVAAMAWWLWTLAGGAPPPTVFDPITWHAHEMLFGFVVAAIAGFLLTAIPNWTGRLPVRGWRLAALAGLWLAGRIAVAVSALIGAGPAAAIDVAFLVALAATVLREIVAGGNWRNLPMAAVIAGLAVCNLLVHLDFVGHSGTASLGLRLGIAIVAFLIAVVGGRIVPSFTRNWLQKREAGRPSDQVRGPAPFGWPDRAALAATAVAGLAWAAAPEARATGAMAILAALALGVRLSRWCGLRTLAEPLLWVLHLGYGWLAAGFALLGLSLAFDVLPVTAAFHALTAGAMGSMTLAVMTRATLGHTGAALTAGRGTTAVYGLVSVAALSRVLVGAVPDFASSLAVLAGIAWIAAFALFTVIYAPLLVAPPKKT
jgi:uncharacterized protein involved in response to NO